MSQEAQSYASEVFAKKASSSWASLVALMQEGRGIQADISRSSCGMHGTQLGTVSPGTRHHVL